MPVPTRIITDFQMPLFDGLGVLSWVRGNPHFQNLPVTIISSSISPEQMERAKVLKATEVLEKPASLEELVAMVKRWAGKS